MTLRRLRWIALAGLVGLVVGLEVVRGALYPALLSWPVRLLMASVVAVGVAIVYMAAASVMEGMQAQLRRRNRELDALYRAGIDIAAELDLESVLQKIVDRARHLLEARYSALAVYDGDGTLVAFLTSGAEPGAATRIGSGPRGRGLLGAVLRDGDTVRLRDLTADPRFEGFPPGHPPMRTLLVVPVASGGPLRGNLYVADRHGEREFSADDESTLRRFAAQAAVAASNAHLHRRVRDLAVSEERLRIAHEMHDGLAQVLAYVNAKLQAVRQHVAAGDSTRAVEQLDQLAAAARQAYGDVRGGILDLRAARMGEGPFVEMVREYLERWSDRTGVRGRVEGPAELSLSPAVELQLMRILQEALANVRKHAAAHHVTIRLSASAGAVELTIEDDGIGFDPEHPGRGELPRFGLSTMRERAESIAAVFHVRSAPGSGTGIHLRVPGPTAAEKAFVDARAHR